MAKISGILRDPVGRPIPNCTIELKALKHTLTVIKATTAGIGVENSGSYSMNVEPNEYQVKLHITGLPPVSAGNIHVYNDSPDGSLNSFLSEPGKEDLTPEMVKIFQTLADQSTKAAEKTNKDSEQIAADKSSVEVLSQQVQIDCSTVQRLNSNVEQINSNLKQVELEMLAVKDITEENEKLTKEYAQQVLADKTSVSILKDDVVETNKVVQELKEQTKNYADNAEKVVSQANIASVVNKQMRQVLYIDNVSGSDNNNGLTISTPLKTFTGASALIPSGATATLYIMSDYGFSEEETAVTFQGANILIRSQLINSPVTIKFNYHIAPAYPEQYFMTSFIFYYSGTIEFCNINLELPDIPSNHSSGKYYPHGASVIRTNSSTLAAVQLGVRLYTVNIIVPEPESSEWHFIGNPRGMTDLVLVGATLPSAWRDRNKMFFEGRLSETVCCKRTVNVTTAMSKDSSVYNDGRVK